MRVSQPSRRCSTPLTSPWFKLWQFLCRPVWTKACFLNKMGVYANDTNPSLTTELALIQLSSKVSLSKMWNNQLNKSYDDDNYSKLSYTLFFTWSENVGFMSATCFLPIPAVWWISTFTYKVVKSVSQCLSEVKFIRAAFKTLTFTLKKRDAE